MGLSRLFLNLKLLKDGLRVTSAVGGDGFDREVASELPCTSSDEATAVAEATWMVRRAVSELHVMHKHRQAATATDCSAVSVEVALSSELVEAQAALAEERRARRAAEREVASRDAAVVSAAEAVAAARQEAAQAQADAESTRIEAVTAAVSAARREGEVACARLADRLNKAEARAAAAEHGHFTADGCPGPQPPSAPGYGRVGHTEHGLWAGGAAEGDREAPSVPPVPPAPQPMVFPPGGLTAAKERRLQQLEKSVAAMRRREQELTGANHSLEARVERLTKDLKGARPAPNSRAKVTWTDDWPEPCWDRQIGRVRWHVGGVVRHQEASEAQEARRRALSSHCPLPPPYARPSG